MSSSLYCDWLSRQSVANQTTALSGAHQRGDQKSDNLQYNMIVPPSLGHIDRLGKIQTVH